VRVVPLGSIAAVNPGGPSGAQPDTLCSFVPMELVDGTFGTIVKSLPRRVGEVERGYTPFRDGDVLFAKITPCMENGKCAIATGLIGGLGFGSTEFHVVRRGPAVIAEWIYYFLRQESTRREGVRHMTGTAGQQRVPARFLEEITIPLPSLGEQQRIAGILTRADRLRRLRRFARELSDGYLQSVFLQMFGDPVRNPKGWRVRLLRSLSLKFSDGPFGSNLKTEHYTDAGVRVIRLQNIGVGELLDQDKAYVSEAHFASIAKHQCLPGDIIVGTLGDPNLRACILPTSIPMALNKADCVQIRVDPSQGTPEAVCCLLNQPATLHVAQGMIHGQTRTRISMGQLAELPLPVPPLQRQREFSQIVHRFERLRAQQREAERQAQHLFQALLQRAFRGEV